MSDARDQVERVLAESDTPVDGTTENPLEPDIHPDRTRQFRSTSFARMKTTWSGPDAAALADVQFAAAEAIKTVFPRALRVLARLQEAAWVPVIDTSTGEPERHLNGSVKYVTDEWGDRVEDWSRLDPKTRSDILFTITTHAYEWESNRVRLWAEAMYAKVLWEQAFSYGFRTMAGSGAAISGKPTIDDRTQVGHAHSAQDRYFGVFQSSISRQADALVRTLDRIARLLENVSDH